MNKLKHTGIKISDYPSSITNIKDYPHKLEHNHYFITYAPTYFGTSTINKNYKIPLEMLRQDQMFYIGLNNAKGDWQNLLSIWSGYWYNEDKTESYVYEWKHEERGSNDYIKNKFGLEPDEDKIDRIFFIKDAPIPMEESQPDPNPATNKFVNKKYIDDRFNGVRKLPSVEGTLTIRPYTCVYEYSSTPTEINIIDTDLLQDGRTVADCLQNNILTFIIKFPVSDSDVLSILANGKDNVKWSYPSELEDILHAARSNNYSDVWLECFAGYKNGNLCIRCSNALNPMPGSEKQLVTTDSIQSGNFNVPTSNAVYHFVKNELSSINNKVEEGDFITVTNNVISVKTSSDITNDASTVPTTQAVYDEFNTRLEELKFNETNNGISLTQENGVITNVSVNSAIVNTDGNISEETKNNVIIGSEVQKIIDSISAKFADFGFKYEISAYLPKPSAHYKNYILLVPDSTTSTDNEYNEYICLNKPNKGWAWEQIGNTKIDLSDYVRTDVFEAKIKEINDLINKIKTSVDYQYNDIKGSTQKMNFKGKYVQLVTNEDGSIDLIFGPNNNPSFFSKLSEPTTSSLFVYKPVNGSYTFPENQAGNVKYTYCSPNNKNQTIYLKGENNENEICNNKPFTLTCTISHLGGNDIEVKVENIDGSQSSYTVEDNNKILKVEITNVVKNTLENNPDGTPGYIRYEGKITVNQNAIAPNGDWYTLTVSNGDVSKSTVQIFAYEPSSNNQYPNFATKQYITNKTRTVSGIVYDESGSLSVRVNDIAGTQNQVTENLNRLKLSISDANNKIVFNQNSKTYITDDLELQSGNKDSDNIVYYMRENFTATVTTKDNAVTKLNTTATAQAGQQSGFNSGSATPITSTSYIWTKPNNTTDTSLISYFTEDGSYRKLGYINKTTNKLVLVGDESYNNTAKLNETDYNKQLMIQGGKIKYPKSDITEEYQDLSGTRYYVRAIQFPGTDQIFTFKINFNSGLGNTFPSGIRMYLAKDQQTELQELTAAKNKGLNGCSKSDAPSNGTWTVAPEGKFDVMGGETYYFIIEYNSDSTFLSTELGTLTITR